MCEGNYEVRRRASGLTHRTLCRLYSRCRRYDRARDSCANASGSWTCRWAMLGGVLGRRYAPRDTVELTAETRTARAEKGRAQHGRRDRDAPDVSPPARSRTPRRRDDPSGQVLGSTARELHRVCFQLTADDRGPLPSSTTCHLQHAVLPPFSVVAAVAAAVDQGRRHGVGQVVVVRHPRVERPRRQARARTDGEPHQALAPEAGEGRERALRADRRRPRARQQRARRV